MNAAELAAALGAVGFPRRSVRGPWYRVRCPSHDDRTPSLDITDANGSILMICRAGCTQREVIEALRSRGLWAPSALAVRHAPPINWGDGPTRLKPCCLEGPCVHWQEFDADMTIARLHANLREAVAEVVGLVQTAKYELAASELREELKPAVEVAGSAIVPWHMTADIVEKMISLVVAEALGDAAARAT